LELLLVLFLEFLDHLFLLVNGLDLFGLELEGNSLVAEVLFLEAFVVLEQLVLRLLGQRGPVLLHGLVLPVEPVPVVVSQDDVLLVLLHLGLHLLEFLLGHLVYSKVSRCLLRLVLNTEVEREVGGHIIVLIQPHDLVLEDRQLLPQDAGYQVGVGVPELLRKVVEHDGHLGMLVGHPSLPALRDLTQDLVREGPQLEGVGFVLVGLGPVLVDPVVVLEVVVFSLLLFEICFHLTFLPSISLLLLSMLLSPNS
jgi:hypothetical protein